MDAGLDLNNLTAIVQSAQLDTIALLTPALSPTVSNKDKRLLSMSKVVDGTKMIDRSNLTPHLAAQASVDCKVSFSMLLLHV